MNMKRIEKPNECYSTSDLACAGVLALWFPIEAVDRTNPQKAVFLFSRTAELDRVLERYWKGEQLVEPKQFFAQLKILKSRIYEER